MGILSDRDIRYCLEPGGGLVIEPTPQIIQPTSVDLHLGDTLLIPSGGQMIDPAEGMYPRDIERLFKTWFLFPGQFVLGATQEHVEIPPALVGILMGKSSLARWGVQIEAAGYVDPGWKGQLTLEIYNFGRNTMMLRPGMPICQIRFEALHTNTCENLYGSPALNSHYQHSRGPVSGRMTSLEPAEPLASDPRP